MASAAVILNLSPRDGTLFGSRFPGNFILIFVSFSFLPGSPSRWLSSAAPCAPSRCARSYVRSYLNLQQTVFFLYFFFLSFLFFSFFSTSRRYCCWRRRWCSVFYFIYYIYYIATCPATYIYIYASTRLNVVDNLLYSRSRGMHIIYYIAEKTYYTYLVYVYVQLPMCVFLRRRFFWHFPREFYFIYIPDIVYVSVYLPRPQEATGYIFICTHRDSWTCR